MGAMGARSCRMPSVGAVGAIVREDVPWERKVMTGAAEAAPSHHRHRPCLQ